MILVDTSVWIDYLRAKETPAAAQLSALIQTGDVAINEIIFNEICLGAKDMRQFQKYTDYFSKIPILKLEDWHIDVAELRFLLKKKGATSYLPDALIAYTAMSYSIPLLTKDKDFEPFAKHSTLSLELC